MPSDRSQLRGSLLVSSHINWKMIHSRQLIFETQVTRADKNSENTKMDSHNSRGRDG